MPIARWLNIQIGQFRVPFSRQELVSGARFQFAVTSLWSGSANQDNINFIPSFDDGAMIWGWFGPKDMFEYYAGVFNGQGRNHGYNDDAKFMYAGRVVFNPLGRPRFQESYAGMREPSLAIALDGVWYQRQTRIITQGTTMVPNVITATYLGADLAAFAGGFSLYGELYYRDTHETDTVAVQSTESFGVLAQAGVFPFHFFSGALPYIADPARGCLPLSRLRAVDVHRPSRTDERVRGALAKPATSQNPERPYPELHAHAGVHLRGELVPVRARIQDSIELHDQSRTESDRRWGRWKRHRRQQRFHHTGQRIVLNPNGGR